MDKSSQGISRRELLSLSIALPAVWLTVCQSPAYAADDELVSVLKDWPLDPVLVASMGRSCADALYGLHKPALEHLRRIIANKPASRHAQDCLKQAIAEDHRLGRISRVMGWRFTDTEIAIAAVAGGALSPAPLFLPDEYQG